MSIIVQHRRDSRANCEANTPAIGEIWYDTTLKALRHGDGATLGGLLGKRWGYEYPLSPAQIMADQNDYAPADFAISETLFLNSDAARSVTGLAGGYAGARRTLVNRGGFDITLVNASVLSGVANRFLFESDVVLRPNSAIALQYSVTDSRWMRADGGIKFSTMPQELLMTGVITPAQITADQNNYAPVDAVTATKTTALSSILRLSSDASRNITGLVDARDGATKVIINSGANPIVLVDASVASLAANRFDFGASVTLAAKQSARIRYDGTDSRWKLEAATAGAGVAAGAVTAQTLSASALGSFVGMVNGIIVESHVGNAVTFAIKTKAGADPTAADPVYFVVRHPSIDNGSYVVRTVTAAMSLTISSGSSLGATNATAFRIWLTAVDTGAGVTLGAINCRSASNGIYPLRGYAFLSSTAEGGAGAADSAQVMYTAAAQATKPYVVLGYASYESGLAAAGSWDVSPTQLQLYGHGVSLPGDRVQSERVDTSAVATGTTLLPTDDTIPQNTEGDQFMSLSITPTSACNIAKVRAQAQASFTSLTSSGCGLFRDSVANALVAHTVTIPGANHQIRYSLDFAGLMGSTAATTFKFRAGTGTGGATFTFNGQNSTRIFGGVNNAFMEIEEIMG